MNEASTSSASPTLSVCCVTNAPPAQVAAVFAPFREMAEGFVIVFDDRVPPSWVQAYERLSSRCAPVTFEHLERHLTLAHELCTTDWVLRLDTDEVASPALLARLPALLADPAIREYRLARRWLYRSPTTWLDEVPWTPDHQTRLVRSSPTLHCSGKVHSTDDPREFAAYVEEPLYHLDCIVNDLTARRLKALWYEVLRPDLRVVGGLPMRSYYQPEDFARRPLAAVPEADRDAIAAMLAVARPVLATDRGPAATSEVGPEPLADGIEWLERDRRFLRGGDRPIVMRITNRTAQRWPGFGDPDAVVVCLQWIAADRSILADEQLESLILPMDPGTSRVLAPVVGAPDATGSVQLQIQVRSRSGQTRSPRATIRFDLEDAMPAPTSREVRPGRRRGLRLLLRRHPGIPRILHRIWLGGGEMPETHARCGESWKEHHPDWTFRLWTDADAPMPDGVERARNVGERTDLVRYEILRRHGGIYADTDVECLRPLDELLDGVVAFAGYEVPGRLCNALIGAVPGHRAFTDAVVSVQRTVGTGLYPFATATTFLTRVLEPVPDVTLFAAERFYPYLWDEPDPGPAGYGDAYAVHHWAKSWLPPS